MQVKHLVTTAVAALALILSASASATTINFDQSNANAASGTISYGGEGGALTGSGITFSSIIDNDGDSLTCVSCTLSFSTGDNISEGLSTGLWQFAGGGTLTLIGTLVDSGGNIIVDDGVLFTGTFGDTVQLVAESGSTSFTVSLSGNGEFNSLLAAALGVSANSAFEFSFTSIAEGSATYGENGSFSSTGLQNADMTALASNDVPEPSQVSLFGLGLMLVLGGLIFRRKHQDSSEA